MTSVVVTKLMANIEFSDPNFYSRQEWYGDHAGCVAAVERATDSRLEQRLLLAEDAEVITDLVEQSDTLRTGTSSRPNCTRGSHGLPKWRRPSGLRGKAEALPDGYLRTCIRSSEALRHIARRVTSGYLLVVRAADPVAVAQVSPEQ